MYTKDDFVLLLMLLSNINALVVPPMSSRGLHKKVGVAWKGGLHVPLMSHHHVRRDTEFIFGSDSADEKEEEDEEDYTIDQRRRQEVVNEILQKDEEKYKEERRKKKWGEFADAKSKEDIRRVEKSIKAKISKENKQKLKLAEMSGVQMDFLEAQDTVLEENGNIRISTGTSSANWYSKMDEDLQKEWEELESSNEEMADGQTGPSDTIQVNGKVVSRNALQGVRVGSAGGWSLELFPGDFLVHRRYGIGRFERTCVRSKSKLTEEEQIARDERRGAILKEELTKIPGGVTADDIQRIRSRFGTEDDTDPISNPQSTVLEITYADGVVHVPVERAYRLSRYRSRDAVIKPKLSKVRGDAWRNAKRRVEENTLELAQDVLALYATRETLQRKPFDPAKEDEVKDFGTTFKFEPTPDQARCFEDVENDMVWRSRPMDRLVCGDVGFGKTEVAMRAIYRAVANGRQAALLAPTGVLASQHFKNVVKRMGEDTRFGKRVVLLRGGMGKRTKAGMELRRRIECGEVDVVVGTHSLITGDMTYNNLGLLVVDEEQRFGVKQKERLKLICGGIDVLTLSATPIPRTLQMSLSGIRDTSTIRSPPPMRKPTITYVQDFSMEVVKTAIRNELDRGGQSYYGASF
jgi:transcription-repair coupling factor (superfamily II helicase)